MKNARVAHYQISRIFSLAFISACILLCCLLGVQSPAYAASNNSNRYAGPVLTTDTQASGAAQGWKYLNKNWYYYGSNGLPVTGIKEVPWRYKDSNGKWQTEKNYKVKYYFNSAGAMQTGWQKIKGTWYYFDKSSGEMARYGVRTIDKKVYVFTASGSLVTKPGWVKISYSQNTPTWHYIKNKSGEATTGWKKISGKWYYFDPQYGYMYNSGGYKIGKHSYLFSKSGALVTKAGWQKIKWSNSYTSWYYVKNSSGYLQTGWKKIGGKWYYFDLYMYSDGFRTIGHDKYYFNKSGAMKTGWLQLNNRWYYLKSDGRMATGGQYIKGNYYYFCPGDGHLMR